MCLITFPYEQLWFSQLSGSLFITKVLEIVHFHFGNLLRILQLRCFCKHAIFLPIEAFAMIEYEVGISPPQSLLPEKQASWPAQVPSEKSSQLAKARHDSCSSK